MRWMLLGTLAALAMMPAGCGKSSGQNSSDPSSSEADVSAEFPTTQQILDGPRTSIPLWVMPLALSVPEGWKVGPPVHPSFLIGRAPDGNLQISISMLDFMDDHRMNVFVSGEEDLSEKHPQRTQVTQSTTRSGLHVVETITYSDAGGNASSRPSTQPSQLLSWNIVVFVPYQKKFIPCSFDLLSLTQQQYTDDEPLVHSIIDSAEPNNVSGFQ